MVLPPPQKSPPHQIVSDSVCVPVAAPAEGDGASDAGDNTGDISLWSDTIIRGNTSYTDYASDDIVINKTELEEKVTCLDLDLNLHLSCQLPLCCNNHGRTCGCDIAMGAVRCFLRLTPTQAAWNTKSKR